MEILHQQDQRLLVAQGDQPVHQDLNGSFEPELIAQCHHCLVGRAEKPGDQIGSVGEFD